MEEFIELFSENQELVSNEAENNAIVDNVIAGVENQEINYSKESIETLSKPVKHLRLPFSKIKQIMKLDPDVQLIQQDAVFLVSKATEMFIEYLSKESNKQLAKNKRKTVAKRDIDVTIETIPQLCFLDGALE